jgi:hypothetical protein
MATATTTRSQRVNVRQPLMALALVGAGMAAGFGLTHLPEFASGGGTAVSIPTLNFEASQVWRDFRTEETRETR